MPEILTWIAGLHFILERAGIAPAGGDRGLDDALCSVMSRAS